MIQTILGSGGAIGIPLANALKSYPTGIRLVSRNPKKINESDEIIAADLTNSEQVLQALAGSSVCYLLVGLEYNTKIWKDSWPLIMKNVVEACMAHECKLVFFDNVYGLDPKYTPHMTESTPLNPTSEKGKIRAALNRYIMDQVEKKKLNAIIARAPDYFGPVKEKSLLMNLVYDNMKKGKSAQWLCQADVKHTIGYTLDLAAGTAILGNSRGSFNQIWNLPVDDQALTARQWVKLFATELQASEKVKVLPGWGIWALGLFVPILKETYEMKYQYEQDYYFDSKKFKSEFNFTPTKNLDAIKQTIEKLNSDKV